jgi:hypothetical protein
MTQIVSQIQKLLLLFKKGNLILQSVIMIVLPCFLSDQKWAGQKLSKLTALFAFTMQGGGWIKVGESGYKEASWVRDFINSTEGW